MRSRFSKKNKYYISRHVFLTVYHYCLNYNDWVQAYNDAAGLHSKSQDTVSPGTGDPTASQAMKLADLFQRIETIRQTAFSAEPDLNPWLLQYVTNEGMTFDKLKAKGMPCERDMFYDRRRKFYWMMAVKLKFIK